MKTTIGNKKSNNKQTILMHNDNKIIDPQEIAHISNVHFINIGFDLQKISSLMLTICLILIAL